MAAAIGGQPETVGGSKWDRELAAFKLLFDWAVARGHMVRSPVVMRTVRLRDGSTADVAANKAKDVRVSNVTWFTPRGALPRPGLRHPPVQLPRPSGK